MSEETKRDKNSLRELFKRIDDDYYFFRGLHNREDFVLKKTDKGVRFIIHGTEYDEKSSEIIKGYVGINNDNVPCFMALLGFVDRDFFSDRELSEIGDENAVLAEYLYYSGKIGKEELTMDALCARNCRLLDKIRFSIGELMDILGKDYSYLEPEKISSMTESIMKRIDDIVSGHDDVRFKILDELSEKGQIFKTGPLLAIEYLNNRDFERAFIVIDAMTRLGYQGAFMDSQLARSINGALCAGTDVDLRKLASSERLLSFDYIKDDNLRNIFLSMAAFKSPMSEQVTDMTIKDMEKLRDSILKDGRNTSEENASFRQEVSR